MRGRAVRVGGLLLLFGAIAAHVCAQQLAIRWYGTEQGLASSGVNAIFQDSRGYLWIATAEGVSPLRRFCLRHLSRA